MGRTNHAHWLRAFVLMGLAKKRDGRWMKLREPNQRDLALTQQQADQPYASSSVVLEAFEAAA